MPSEPAAGLRPQRLHPVSLLFSIGKAARSLLVPGMVVLVMSRGGVYQAWWMLLFLPAVAGYLSRYLTFRYWLGPEEMVIREGLLTRNERHIPYARIQNIDLVQNPLHRAFGVAAVRLETASGGKPEAVIRVLSMPAVNEMRSRVFAGRDAGATVKAEPEEATAGQAETDATAPRRLLELPLSEIVLFGLISNRGFVVVAALMGLLSQTGFWETEVDEWAPALVERAQESSLSLVQDRALQIGLLVLVGLLALVVLMRVLSVTWAIYKLYGFRLTRRGDDLRAEYGLWTRVSTTVPRRRIQLLSTRASRLHRLFGRVAVYAETAGGGGAEEGESGRGRDKQWMAPLIRESEVGALIRELMPDLDLDGAEWQPLEPRAWRRLFKRGLLVLLLVTAGSSGLIQWWSLLLLLVGLPLVALHARRWVASAAWLATPQAVLFRSGWWGRRMSVVPIGKIQALALTESPFDRHNAMASVSVDTAGAGRIGHRVSIPFLAAATARRLSGTLYDQSSRTAFRW